MEHVPGSVVPPKVVNPSMLVTWWTAQIQNAPVAHTARLELLVLTSFCLPVECNQFVPNFLYIPEICKVYNFE